MSFRDEVKAAIRQTGPRCTVAQAAAQLQGSDHDDFAELVEDLDVPATAIIAPLRTRGIVLGHQSIGRHRRRECLCPR